MPFGQRSVGRDERRQALLEASQRAAVEAAAHVAGPAQAAGRIGRGQHQRAQVAGRRARALAGGETGDDEFVTLTAFELDPVRRAPVAVGGAGALADHAFHAQLAGAGQQAVRVGRQLLGQAQHGRVVGGQQFGQAGAAVGERGGAPVLAIEPEQVEQVINERVGLAAVKGVLQRAEVGQAIGAGHDDFAVEPRVLHGQGGHRAGQRGHARRPVEAVAGEELHAAGVDARQQAVAVELQLPQPVGGVGRRIAGQRGELGGDGVGQRGRFFCFVFDSCLRMWGKR